MIHPSAEHFTSAMTHSGFAPCNEDSRFAVPGCSGICTEVETLALLFGFVRTLRPRVVVETGCNVGCAAQAICSALEANGGGQLHTCDIEAAYVEATYQHVAHKDRLLYYLYDGLELVKTWAADADMYFIDSSDSSRMAELKHLRDHGKPGAIVLVHDTSLYTQVRQVVETFPRYVILPGPRGLGVITL